MNKFFKWPSLLEFSEVLISKQGSKDGGEVAEEWEGVIDDGRIILVEVELRLEVDHQDGWNRIHRFLKMNTT